MEHISGISLHSLIKSKPFRRLDEAHARGIFKQIVSGIRYCHSKCITHRDIKLENILYDEKDKIHIIDFGFSTCIPNDKKIKIFCGTPSYMAPEIVSKKEYEGPPADIWALGVLLYAILCGTFPYKGSTDKELYTKICKPLYILPEHLSPAAVSLLDSIFQVDPEMRPTASKMLVHPWMTGQEPSNQIPYTHLRSQSFGFDPLSKTTPKENRNAINSNNTSPPSSNRSSHPFNIEAYQEYFNNRCYENKNNTAASSPSNRTPPVIPQSATPKLGVPQTINNNFNIVNHITEVTCKCHQAPCPHEKPEKDVGTHAQTPSSVEMKQIHQIVNNFNILDGAWIFNGRSNSGN